MKKTISIFLLLFIPSILFPQITGQLEIDRNKLSFSKEEGYDKICYGDYHINDVGKPEIPVIYRSYVIPLEAVELKIEVGSENREPVDGNYLLFPVQPQKTDRVGILQDFARPDSSVYNSILPFPSEPVAICSDEIVQGYRVITLALYPFEYIPKSRTLSIRQFNYIIDYGMGATQKTQDSKISARRSELAKTFVKSMVCNPNEVDTYTDRSNVLPETSDLNRFPVNPKLRSLNVMDRIVPDFVIITNNEMKDAFQRLADWKTKRGIPTVIQTVEDINKNYNGASLVEKIKSYLTDVGKRWNENSLSILLGGDTDIIPTRLVKAESEPPLQCTDACYSSNNLNWNAQNFRCNETTTISSYLGRLPVRNSSEATNFINKIISYEKSSQQGIDYSYYNNFLFSGAFMKKEKNKPPKDGYMEVLDTYRKTYLTLPANYWYLFDHFGCKKDDHENKNQNYDASQGAELNKANFVSALVNGTRIGRIHFIFHKDHSVTSSFGISSEEKGEAITNEDADNMTDTPYYNIIMSGSCHPADFVRDCIAEHFVNKQGGTVAFIGNSDVGWRNEYNQFEYALKALFATPQTSGDQYNIGYILLQSLIAQKSNYQSSYRLHLLGDPTMPVWTATPKKLNVIVTPEIISNGATTITVQITNLPTGHQAMVCLKKGIEGYATRTVKDTRIQRFTFTPKTAGVLDVTVTAHNFIPFEKTIQVTPDKKSTVRILNHTLIDNRTEGCDGNGDGCADAGETVEMLVRLKNDGNTAAGNVRGMLSCNSTYISILSDSVRFGTIPANSSVSGQNRFRFKINPETPETLKNDFNAICFYLDLKDAEGNLYTDTLQLDVFAQKLELRDQVISGIVGPGSQNGLYVNLMNTGRSHIPILEAILEPEPESSFVEDCPGNSTIYTAIDIGKTVKNRTMFTFTTKNTYQNGYPLKMKLTVRNEYGREWIFHIDPNEKRIPVSSQNIGFRSHEKSIELFWTAQSKASGYNIYKSLDGENGNYRKINPIPISTNYFVDEQVGSNTTYFYKISTVSRTGNESTLSGAVKIWTTLPSIGSFPRFKSGSVVNLGSVCVSDVNNDGKKEIFNQTKIWTSPPDGFLLGMDYQGNDLFDIDNNPTTFSGFAQLVGEAWATPAIGDLYGNGEQNILVSTRIDPYKNSPKNRLTCFVARDNNDDRLPDILWENLNNEHVYTGAVLSNLDNSVDGTMEVIVEPDDQWQPVSIYDNTGKVICKLGPGKSLNSNINSPAVADLDKDGDKEIVVGYEDGVHIWHHNGKPYSTNPVFTRSKISFSSSPVICDLDNDGRKEIVVAAKDTLTAECTVFAIRPDGTLVPGWNGTQKFSSGLVKWESCNLSVGDINGDGKLEVCVIGADCLKIWKNNGTILISKNIPGAKGGDRVPILADVNGDSRPDVLFTVGSSIHAMDCEGKDIPGFPVNTDFPFIATVCVNDIDGDGKSELVAVDEVNTYVWKTNGNPNAIEWGSFRHDPQNTGEYGKICEPQLILSSQTWSGVDPCGNVIVERGTLTIPSGKTLSLTDKTSKIIVRPGASLVVDGGTISNAYVRALSGGHIILKNGGKISLRDGGKMTIDKGASFSNQEGSIETIY